MHLLLLIMAFFIVGGILLKWLEDTIRRIVNIIALLLVLVFIIGAFLYITGNPV
jgi:uncharacterized membrane protein